MRVKPPPLPTYLVPWQPSSPFSNPLLFVIPTGAKRGRDLRCAIRVPQIDRGTTPLSPLLSRESRPFRTAPNYRTPFQVGHEQGVFTPKGVRLLWRNRLR